jgi:hypothetical protein
MRVVTVTRSLLDGREKSQLELDYAFLLEHDPLVVDWKYEPVTFRLADDTRYTPDFWVLRKDGTLEFHETKGFMRPQARIRLMVAAAQFPEFRFFLVTRPTVKSPWKIEEMKT